MKETLVVTVLLVCLIPGVLSISCYSCSTFEVDPGLDEPANHLRQYVIDNQQFPLISQSLSTDCEGNGGKMCAGDRCIASHIKLSKEAEGELTTLGTIELHECGSLWLETEQKFCKSAETGISDDNLKAAKCYMSTCQEDLCNIPNALLEPLTSPTNEPIPPVAPTQGNSNMEDEAESADVKDGEQFEEGMQANNQTEGVMEKTNAATAEPQTSETDENDSGAENGESQNDKTKSDNNGNSSQTDNQNVVEKTDEVTAKPETVELDQGHEGVETESDNNGNSSQTEINDSGKTGNQTMDVEEGSSQRDEDEVDGKENGSENETEPQSEKDPSSPDSPASEKSEDLDNTNESTKAESSEADETETDSQLNEGIGSDGENKSEGESEGESEGKGKGEIDTNESEVGQTPADSSYCRHFSAVGGFLITMIVLIVHGEH